MSPSMLSADLAKRQSGDSCNGYGGFPCNNDGYGGWWYTDAGYATRYGITAAIIVLILLYFVGGYLHGKNRVRKGLQPMRYHRWMFRANNRHAAYNSYNYAQRPVYGANGAGPGYEMNPGVWRPDAGNGQPPPPAYNTDIPPAYVPPPGASKIAPQQEFTNVDDAERNRQPSSSADVERPGQAYRGEAPAYR